MKQAKLLFLLFHFLHFKKNSLQAMFPVNPVLYTDEALFVHCLAEVICSKNLCCFEQSVVLEKKSKGFFW